MYEPIALYVYWQDSETRRWHVVGRLSRADGLYKFVYTKGSLASKHFIPFGRMTNLCLEYQSPELFPLFSNRILQKSRPEFRNYLEWLALDDSDADPLMLLGRSGGLRGTDNLGLYPAPTPDQNNMYRVTFFCHGLRYIPEFTHQTLPRLRPGDELYPMHDMQNEWDGNALALRTKDPVQMIGYCPRYFAKDFLSLLRKKRSKAQITIVKINHDAPIEFRALCEFQAPWPAGFKACRDGEYQALTDETCENSAFGTALAS